MTVRKAHALKLLANTARPDRIAPAKAALPALDCAPTAPTWLTNLEAVKEWNRLAPLLTVNKLLNAANCNLLAQYCALHGRLVQMWTAGNPTAALITAFRRLSSDLGLTGMTLPAAPAKANRFLNFGKRR